MWTRPDGINASEERAVAWKQTGEAREDLIKIAENVAKALPKGIADNLELSVFAEALCELVRHDTALSAAFDPEARVSGEELVTEAMVRIAGREGNAT